MRKLVLGCAVAAMVALAARSEARPPELRLLQAPRTSPYRVQVGVASWYGEECQGKYTASGEPFDMNGLTCASRSLPLGTRIKITNLLNYRSVVLRVNDRGPAIVSRMVDVSRRAAERLGFTGAGLTTVSIEVVSFPKDAILVGQMPFVMASNRN